MKVLIDADPYPPAMERLQAIPGLDLHLLERSDDHSPTTRSTSALANAEACFCTIPPQNLDDAKSLRFIQINSSGYSQLFNLGLNERSIRAANASGVFDIAIAEWIIAMTINLGRNLRGLIRNQEAGIFDRDARFQRELRGSTIGFWGYGGIAREAARLSKAMGLVVHTMTRAGVQPRVEKYAVPGTGDPLGKLPDRVYQADDEDAFLRGLDVLVLTMPLTKATEGIIGERELRALRPTAFLLNPARGPLIEEQALLKSLREQWFAGAAIDAHYAYPLPADHSLWRFPNVILTPHISGSTAMPYFQQRTWDIFVQNIERLHNRQPLLNELSAAQVAGK